jgi:hypothetical protein
MLYIMNAFSCNMIKPNYMANIYEADLCCVKEVLEGAEYRSVVGHKDTAAILSGILGRNIVENRETIMLEFIDVGIIAQYSGPRLAEGTTILPEGANFRWFIVGTEYHK